LPAKTVGLRHFFIMRHNSSPEVSTKVLHSKNCVDCRCNAAIALLSFTLFIGVVGCGKSEPPAVKPEDVAVTMPGSPDASKAASIEAPLTPPVIDMPPAAPPDANPATPDAAQPTATAAVAEESTDGPEDHLKWPAPQLAIVLTGNQYGYIEPCGCTGLENQKGGLARRMTFMRQLSDMGWEVLPIDAGNQVRRFGRQAEIKFQTTAGGLEQMGYRAVGFGPDDLRLGVGELVAAVAAADDPQDGLFVSSNVTLIDPSLTAQFKVIDQGGRKVGVTSALDPASLKAEVGGEIEVGAVAESIKTSLAAINEAGADFRILLFYGEEAAAAEAVRTVPGFDLVIVAGGFGEPLYRPQSIDGTETKMIVTGNKGMYAGVVALYADQPYRYARVAIQQILTRCVSFEVALFVDLLPCLREIAGWLSCSCSAPAVLVLVLDARAASTITSTISLSTSTIDQRKSQLQNMILSVGTPPIA
jgi:hypothetical protein